MNGAVIAAMPEEVAALRRSLDDVRRVRQRPEIVTGTLAGRPLAICISGDGRENAREGASALLSTLPVERLIAIGVAGALSPELGLFDLIVAERVTSEAGESLQPSAAELERALSLLDARRGIAVSSDAIADSAAVKARLRLASGGTLPAVVDLESASYARVAEDAGIPWLVVRAVSDSASESLPLLLNRSRDERGAVRRGRVIREILTDPSSLPTLLRLRARVRRCSLGLARAVRALSAGERTNFVCTADLGAHPSNEDLTCQIKTSCRRSSKRRVEPLP